MKKRILSILLTACMLLAVIPMAVSAEVINPNPTTTHTAPTAPEGTRKVYLGNTNNITNSEATQGSEENPYTTLQAAYLAATATNTDVEFVFVGDVTEFPTQSGSGTNNYYLTAAEGFTSTIYVDGQNYKLDVTNKTRACVLLFGADTVFNNIKLHNDKNIWLCANAYDLVLGGGIDCSSLGTNVVSIAGSGFSASVKALDTRDDGYEISIYSGTFYEVYIGHRGNDTTALSGNITANIYGGMIGYRADGTVKNSTSYGRLASENNTSSAYSSGANMTINIYDYDTETNNIAQIRGYIPTNLTASIVYHDGCRAKVEGNVKTEVKYYESFADGKNTYDNIYVGVQNTGITSDKYSIRFLAAFEGDISTYDKVGFKVTCGNDDYSKECDKVYTSVVENGEDTISAEELGGNYIFALAIKNIPTSAGEVTFTVQPYVVKAGESTETLCAAYTVTYNAGQYVSSAATAVASAN